MPSIYLTLTSPLNTSLQVGDTAYYVPTGISSSFDVNSSAVIEIGVVTNISEFISSSFPNSFIITCTIGIYTVPPSSGDFILFSKDNKANMSSLLGYYAEVEIRNDSLSKSEMFNISADYFQSSK
tara:strand:- start:425 stop:799 length:375 start_codon:yes stop_codon:yes gene_type:complete